MAIISNTETAAVKQAAIAELVQRELKFSSKLLQTVTDVSVFAKPGDKSVSFPKAGSLTVVNRAPGVQGVSEAVTFTTETLNYDYRAHVQWTIEDMDAYQSKPDIKAELIKRATAAHGRQIDTNILAKLDLNSGHQVAGAISSSKITEGIQFLDQNFAMDQDRYLVLPALGRKQILDIADFVRADSFGNSNIPNGVVGTIFGVNVIIQAGATKAFMYSKEAINWAFQKGAQYGEQADITLGNGSFIAVMDQLYGSLSSRLGEGKALDNTTVLGGTASPFIVEYALV
jgi:hypothetical protein